MLSYVQAQEIIRKKDRQIAGLNSQVASLKSSLKKAEASNTEEPDSTPSATLPSAEDKEAIQAAISTKNYAALEEYLAGTVRLIFAASEGLGDRTPAQVVGDLAYLNAATSPWNFSLTESELSDYATGEYASYFPTSAVVGKSANGYVISFTFDEAGLVSGIFIAANADLL